jgi:hypothetical protein
MAFKHACFISYCHGRYDLVKAFVDQLKAALKAELDPLLDEEVYIDEERLGTGYKYNEELARAICQSVCMIVVYSPRYERHEYCVREFEGMAILERARMEILKERLQALGAEADPGPGCIIPIILRRDDDLPKRITENRHYADFSRFTLATPDMIRNPEYAEEIRKIANIIYKQYKAFRDAAADPCVSCSEFQLPPSSKVVAWRPPQFINR